MAILPCLCFSRFRAVTLAYASAFSAALPP
jgi:hypothetical protein